MIYINSVEYNTIGVPNYYSIKDSYYLDFYMDYLPLLNDNGILYYTMKNDSVTWLKVTYNNLNYKTIIDSNYPNIKTYHFNLNIIDVNFTEVSSLLNSLREHKINKILNV